jgi:hypothetical protein
MWQFPRQEEALDMGAGGCTKQSVYNLETPGRPEQSHNKSINIYGLKKKEEDPSGRTMLLECTQRIT